MRPSNVSLSFTMNFTADWAALRAISSASFGRCPSGTGLYGQMCLEASTGSGKADVSSSQKTISTSSGLHKWQPQSNWYDIKWFELALNEPRFTLHQRVVSDKHLVGLGCQTLKHSFDSILLHRADFDLRLTAILFLTLATAAHNTKLNGCNFCTVTDWILHASSLQAKIRDALALASAGLPPRNLRALFTGGATVCTTPSFSTEVW